MTGDFCRDILISHVDQTHKAEVRVELYKNRLGWTDGLGALIFHGQLTGAVEIYNLTNAFQVAALYQDTRFANAKLMIGYMIGVFSRLLAGYSDGHYLLTEKGGQRQLNELRPRRLKPEEVWVLDPSDPRRMASSITKRDKLA